MNYAPQNESYYTHKDGVWTLFVKTEAICSFSEEIAFGLVVMGELSEKKSSDQILMPFHGPLSDVAKACVDNEKELRAMSTDESGVEYIFAICPEGVSQNMVNRFVQEPLTLWTWHSRPSRYPMNMTHVNSES